MMGGLEGGPKRLKQGALGASGWVDQGAQKKQKGFGDVIDSKI